MKMRRFISVLLSVAFVVSMLTTSVFASTIRIAPMYEYANDLSSDLTISSHTAYCKSMAEGNYSSVKVEQYLEKYSGWFWIWFGVDNASWITTSSRSPYSVTKTKSGLDAGTYRLRTVFTMTASNGRTETVTIYSSEVAVN